MNMDLYQPLYEKCLFPVHERFVKGRRTASIYKDSLKTQWLDTGYHIERQLEALKGLLEFAKCHSAYYGKLLNEYGLDSKKITSINDLSKLPIQNKDIIRENFDDIVTEPFRNSLWLKSTGGSTGNLLHFGYTKTSYEWRVAMSRRGYLWAGAAPGTKQTYIWGMSLAPQGVFARWKKHIHQMLDRHRFFNCFNFESEQMASWLEEINKIRPDVIVGYTNPLYEFARFVASSGGLSFKPKGVISAAEKLHPFQRDAMAQAFGTKVFNTYGAREFMLIGAECDRHEGLHVSMENLIVEVVDEKGMPCSPGQTGRIVVTDLHNYGMPFVRYEIGDLARVSAKQCSCGRGLMLLDDIVGRSLDVIRTSDGKAVPGEFFVYLMMEHRDVYRFQIVQDALDSLRIKVVPNGEFQQATRMGIEKKLTDVVGPAMNVSFEQVSEIPLTPSGKYRVTVSNVGDVVR